MQVVLLKNVPGVGQQGRIINVKDGYALNFLIPQGIGAVPGSNAARRVEQAAQRAISTKLETELQDKEQAESFDGQTTIIASRVDARGKLFGSVTRQHIADVLRIDKKYVQLDQPIRSIGSYPVSLVFTSGIEAHITVQVVPRA